MRKRAEAEKKKRGDAARRIKRRLWGLRDKISQITLFSRMSRGRRLQGKLSRADHTWETLFTCKTHTDADIYSHRSTAYICSWNSHERPDSSGKFIHNNLHKYSILWVYLMVRQSRFLDMTFPTMKVWDHKWTFLYIYNVNVYLNWVFHQKLFFHCKCVHFSAEHF